MFTKKYAEISAFLTNRELYFLYTEYCQIMGKNVTILNKRSKKQSIIMLFRS